MLLSVAILSLAIWLYLAFARGRFWQIERVFLPSLSMQAVDTLIVAVVPARDEADVVGRAVTSLLQQDGARVHVILVDDASTDGTAEAALNVARAMDQQSRLTVLQAPPLPAGWSGKLWAVQQGVAQARALTPDFFLLTDADIVHAPGSLASLLTVAEEGSYKLVSLMVKLHCRSFAERALIPAFVFFFLMLYPPAWISDPRRKTAGAAGGCILIRPQALDAAGGIEAIRNEIIDDCALAARVKRSGGRVWLGVARDAESIRPYTSFSAIGRMISRAAFNQLNHSITLLLLIILGLLVTYVAPPALLLTNRLLPGLLGLAAWLIMSLCFLPTVRLYRLNALWSLTLPAISIFYTGATVYSAFRFWIGRGGEWKGRVQDPV